MMDHVFWSPPHISWDGKETCICKIHMRDIPPNSDFVSDLTLMEIKQSKSEL